MSLGFSNSLVPFAFTEANGTKLLQPGTGYQLLRVFRARS